MPTSQRTSGDPAQHDEEFRALSAKHHELDERLHELAVKSYLPESEQVEEITLKKRKLQLKDRMEDILRRRQYPAAATRYPCPPELVGALPLSRGAASARRDIL